MLTANDKHNKSHREVLRLSDVDTIRLLELYKKENILYDISTTEYRNRDLRTAALKRIANSLNITGFDYLEVSAKFKNLRNAYSQELKKIEDGKKSVTSTDGIYVPKVHWFCTMNSFLRPFIYQRPTTTNCLTEPKKEQKLIEKITDPLQQQRKNDSNIDNDIEAHESLTLSPEAESNNSPNFISSTQTKRTYLENRLYNCGTLKKRRKLSDEISKVASKQDDIYDNFGKYIASLLRSIGTPRALKVQQDITNLVLTQMMQQSSTCSSITSPTPSSVEVEVEINETDVFSSDS